MGGLFCHPHTFARRELSPSEAKYVFLGIPYDSSESYRVGSRFAPHAIREASAEMEDYDLLEDADLLDIRIADIGDLDVSFGSYRETRKRVVEVVKEILAGGSIPVCVGGEHTVTHSVLSAYEEKPFVVVYDAHLDYRDEYQGERFSHACVVRRLAEIVGVEKLLVVGVRSASRGEIKAAELHGLDLIPHPLSSRDISGEILRRTRGKDVYLSIDMDVLDPADARGVGNPEPMGMRYGELLSTLGFLSEANMVGFDLTEVTPMYDSYTPVLAAKIIFKVLLRAEKIKKYKSHGE